MGRQEAYHQVKVKVTVELQTLFEHTPPHNKAPLKNILYCT